MAKGKYEFWLREENLEILGGWARSGLSDEQIACNMGIRRSTLADWKKKYPDISDTLKKGKDFADTQVENALFKRALGYSYTETKEVEKDGIVTQTVKTKKKVLPDVGAAVFWLKNRRPDIWRDKPKEEVEAENGITVVFKGADDKEAKEFAQ